MRKAIYNGGRLPLLPNKAYDIKCVWDDDCGYVYVYISTKEGSIECMYDGREEMEKEWQLIQ